MTKPWRTAGLCALLLVGCHILGYYSPWPVGRWLGRPIGAVAAAVVFVRAYEPHARTRARRLGLMVALALMAGAAMPEVMGLLLSTAPAPLAGWIVAAWSWTWPALFLVVYAGWTQSASPPLPHVTLGLTAFFFLHALAVTIVAICYLQAVADLSGALPDP